MGRNSQFSEKMWSSSMITSKFSVKQENFQQTVVERGGD